MADLSVEICGVKLKNPIIAASGTFGFGEEFNQFYDIGILGGVSTKGLTIKERLGNKTPRIAEGKSVILNSVGLQNPGVESFIKNNLEFLKKSGTVIIANIAGSSLEDYISIAKRLDGFVDMLELNISCPNVKEGGIAFGIKPESVYKITYEIKNCLKTTPLIVKLSPNVESISFNAFKAQEAGADAVSLVNTFTGMAIDLDKRTPILANITGGVSGAGIKPIALKMVYEVAKTVNIPIIGMGGITDYRDALEFIIAGATAVQVGTANFTDTFAMPKIIDGINKYLNEKNIKTVTEMIGSLKVNA